MHYMRTGRKLVPSRKKIRSRVFARRQELAAAIGAYKKARGRPVRDQRREAEVLRSRGDMLPQRRAQAERLMALLMELSREEQS